MLISRSTGGSGTGCADTLLVTVFDVTAWVSPISEPLCRLENASDVVGKDRMARSTSTEEYVKVLMLPP